MNIHIQGICGTFMAGVAVLARALGHTVTGTDRALYPPMSHQIEAAEIPVTLGYEQPLPDPSDQIDQVIVGNALSRGLLQLETVLNGDWPIDSGPSWLASHVLAGRRVLAVSGTHGKTTTSSLLVWILKYAGLDPGYLIGGMPQFSKVSAELGSSPWFVLEADEYDSAFFDKRAKFLQVHPQGIILNNLEFDHADIYKNLKEIQAAFKCWMRTLPSEGLLVCPTKMPSISSISNIAAQWTQVASLHHADAWHIRAESDHFDAVSWWFGSVHMGAFSGAWLCEHLAHNALAAAVLAHRCVGVSADVISSALNEFPGVKRRMECIGRSGDRVMYDDFAHHPTAIEKTLQAIVKRHPDQPVLVCLELGAYTLKQQSQCSALVAALSLADQVFLIRPEQQIGTLDLDKLTKRMGGRLRVFNRPTAIVKRVQQYLKSDTIVVTLSSRDFSGVRQPLFDWWIKDVVPVNQLVEV